MKKLKLLASLMTLASVGGMATVFVACSKHHDPSINVVPNKKAVITGGDSVEQPIELGSFMLFN